ncbi:leucine-rich repeat domain-containing protein [Thalassotalea agarivorans]|uniref:Leucine rich repeat-containing protein n=1 Tax=Thalassotalea agarivorans TaxID=349064 RepID=A0A1I0E512_THASX|nr:hypothetical protein [Thalassotalea agarivorans]SET40096.1 Leucine rich repeat-containing protein [Thalassotalea agarivorans]
MRLVALGLLVFIAGCDDDDETNPLLRYNYADDAIAQCIADAVANDSSLSAFEQVTSLSCNATAIKYTVDFSLFPALSSLELFGDNPGSGTHLRFNGINMPQVNTLTMNNLTPHFLSFAGMTTATNITLDNITYPQMVVFENLVILQSLTFTNSEIKGINLSNNATISSITLNNMTRLRSLRLESQPLLSNLTVTNGELTNATLELPRLTNLVMSNNAIEGISMGLLPALTSVNLSQNKITAIRFDNNPDLTSIDLTDNELSEATISYLESLPIDDVKY